MHSNDNVRPSSKVFICKEEIIKKSNQDVGLDFIKLRHPKLGTAATYTLCNEKKKLYEIIQLNDGFRSWFAGETIIRDGSLYMTSLVNPVYLVLPYLMKPDNMSKFMRLEDIIEDGDFPHLNFILACDFTDLIYVADSKIVDGISYYRFNKEMTLDWLEKRIHFITNYLKENKVRINPSSSIADLITSDSCETTSENEYLYYSFGMVSEYLDDQMTNDLFHKLKLNEPDDVDDSQDVCQPNKKIKMEDSFTTDQKSNSVEIKKSEKMTVAQRKLSKVDKQGMKNISSFFTATATAKKST